MKNKVLVTVLIIFGFFFSCKEDQSTPNIVTGLTVNIAFDGNAYDSVSNTTGIIHEATPAPNRNGISNRSMQFSSSDSAYIDFGDLEGASFSVNEFTIACWVLVIDSASARAVLSKRTPAGPYEYSLDNHFSHSVFNLDNWVASGSGTVYGVDPLNASAQITLGTWQHIAFVADGNFLKVYVNGVLQSSEDARKPNSDFSNTTAPLMIGMGGAFGVNHFFNGCIDDIRMYNRALDAEAIRILSEL